MESATINIRDETGPGLQSDDVGVESFSSNGIIWGPDENCSDDTPPLCSTRLCMITHFLSNLVLYMF